MKHVKCFTDKDNPFKQKFCDDNSRLLSKLGISNGGDPGNEYLETLFQSHSSMCFVRRSGDPECVVDEDQNLLVIFQD